MTKVYPRQIIAVAIPVLIVLASGWIGIFRFLLGVACVIAWQIIGRQQAEQEKPKP